MSQPEDSADDFLYEGSEPESEKRKMIREHLELTVVTMQLMQAYTYAIGVDVRPGLHAAERLLEYLNGEPVGAEEYAADLKLVAEMDAKLKAAPGFPPQWTEQERERWKLLGEGWTMDETIQRWDAWLDILGGGRFTKSLALFRARVGQMTSECPSATTGTDEWLLPLRVELTEFSRRTVFQKIALALYWQQASQDDWQAVEEEMKDAALDFVGHFTEERRKELMDELPIADRRRLEAMEHWTPEEWEKSGPIEP